MAIRNWSTLTNGQVIAFNPATDVLQFDSTSIPAGLGPAGVHLDIVAEPGNVTLFSYLGKDVFLNASIKTLWSGNVKFANGGKFLFGNNAASTAADDSNNTLTGTEQGDRLIGAGGNDRLNGMGGNDYFSMVGHSTTGALGNDTLSGGTGTDQVGFEDAGSAINCNLTTGTSTGGGTIKLISIENVGGTGFSDIITGNGLGNILFGNAGNDRLTGNAGNDKLWGYTGTDTLSGGIGNDILFWDSADFLNGGTGDDTLAVGGSSSALNLSSVPNTKLVDIEAIDLDGDLMGNNGVYLTVTAAEVLAASTTTNTLKVFGSAGDTVKATGFTQMADVMIGVTQFNQYKSGSAILLVEDNAFPMLVPTVIL